MLALAGLTPLVGGRLSFGYIATLLLLDATRADRAHLLAAAPARENAPRRVPRTARRSGHEVKLGVGLTAVVFALAVVVLSAARMLFPALHNVKENPLQQSDSDAGAGADSRHRRDHQRRSARGDPARVHPSPLRAVSRRRALGLVLYSLVFGLGHSLQGWDAVLATTMLGAFWGCDLHLAPQHHRAGRESLGLQRCRNLCVSR